MHFGMHMGGDQSDDAFAVGGREADAQRFAPTAQPIDPQRTVGVEHDFHHVGVVQGLGDVRPHRRAQHAHATFQCQRGRQALIARRVAHEGAAPDSSVGAVA